MTSVTQSRQHGLPHLSLGSPWLRARVWLTRQTLDHRLAAGESMLASAALTRRAGQLTSVRSRRSLAAGIRRVTADAELPAPALSAAVPIQRRAILRARHGLERIAAELAADEPVRLAGIARVQLLLTEGSSPLYTALPDGALDEAVAQAWAALLLD